jgi:UrcA family protein
MIRFLKTASLMAALATLSVAAGAGAAQAETVRIPVADLHLTSAQDPRFEARLDLAARRMCESYTGLSANAACQTAVKQEARDNLADQLNRADNRNLAMVTARR